MRGMLRRWLGIVTIAVEQRETADSVRLLAKLLQRVNDLEAEVVHLKLAAYIPPKPEDPPKKIIKSRNWREFTALTEIEQEQESNHAV